MNTCANSKSYHIAALRLSRQRIIKLKIVQININQSKERLRAILATRYVQANEKNHKKNSKDIIDFDSNRISTNRLFIDLSYL